MLAHGISTGALFLLVGVGLPRRGQWSEVLNSDAEVYGGSNMGNLGGVEAETVPWHDQPFSAALTLPPLGCILLKPDGSAGAAK